MEIITYRELKLEDEFMILMEQAFWMATSPTQMEKFVDWDIRLRNGPVGFCALKDGQLVGFVGVMDIPTKTATGETQIIGGIWCVATNPSFARQGICRTLLEKAHNYFQKQKYPFSFLTTTRTIIAYAFYKKLGYAEIKKVNQFPVVYKVLDAKKTNDSETADPKDTTPLDASKIYLMYQNYIRNKTGFCKRQEDFVNLFSFRKRFDEKKSIEKGNGYALLSYQRGVIRITELVANDEKTYQELLTQIESTAEGVIDRKQPDQKLLKIYQSRGYKFQIGDDEVVMAKPITRENLEEFYGNSFHMGLLDRF